jgi:uncharacterized membrane protein YhaH (DUF805 family)
MPIKDQCNRCKHINNYNVCPNKKTAPFYNGSSCEYYQNANSSIDISKPSVMPSAPQPMQPPQPAPQPVRPSQPSYPNPPHPAPGGGNYGRTRVMTFGDAIQSFFNNYANFEGRARRAEYWYVVLFNAIVSFVLGLLGDAGIIISCIYSLIILIPTFALIWRRLHDTNRSGAYYFIGLIPIIGWILLLIAFCQEGTHGRNQYGDDPKI